MIFPGARFKFFHNMAINNRSKINKVITWLHLWLGLVTGIVVVIVSVTGCLFVFQTEISNLVYKKEFFVTPPHTGVRTLPMHVLAQKARTALGETHAPNYITAYADPGRAWEFMAYEPGDQNAITFPGSVKYYQSAFVNPYTGEITGKINYMHDFFIIVKYIHWSLYLGTKYGQPIVGWGTLLFVISLITGFIMWIPKRWNRTERNKSFTVRWKARWKRLNYDLHNVLGFYTIIIALVLGFTGLVYSFSWFSSAVYAAGSLSMKAPGIKTYQSGSTGGDVLHPVDRAFAQTRKSYPDAKRYGVEMPGNKEASISVTAFRQKEVYYDASTEYFDQYSARPLGKESFGAKNNGEKLILMNYDIHVGAIGGLVGKIIAFIVSLICGSLPVTGFIIWWGKRKKEPSLSRQHRTLREEATA